MDTPNIHNVTEYLGYLTTIMNRNKLGADSAWIANNTYLIFLMQCGFTLLEAGSARHKCYITTMVKNIIDILATTIAWWLVGYGFAYGKTSNGFIGLSHFAGDGLETADDYNNWMFQWAFAGTSATIVSGCILERTNVWGYLFYSFFMTTWIYPVIAHWCWNEGGWLKKIGYLDFAGSGVVHIVGGAAGLTATLFISKRINRFNEEKINEFKPNFVPFVALGTLLLWFSWYGFNCGSTKKIISTTLIDHSTLVGVIGMNTSISAATSGLLAFMVHFVIYYNSNFTYSLQAMCNGILAGLAASTGSCNEISSWAAFIIGLIAGIIYMSYSLLFRTLKIDDPLDAAAIHLGCGSWGVVAVGWFNKSTGILYSKGGKQFGIQVLGAVVIFFWTTICTMLFFFFLKFLKLHRITEDEEIQGIDISNCGGMAECLDEKSLEYYAIKYHKAISRLNQKSDHSVIMEEIEIKDQINSGNLENKNKVQPFDTIAPIID